MSRTLALAGLLFAYPITAPARASQTVELELLLAVDVSSSVDADEFALQMHGLAQAFRHPDVQAAIASNGERGIAVAVMLWSDYAWQALVVNWSALRDARDADSFANATDNASRAIARGGTAISSAISVGMEELNRNRFEGARRVIDISGDGRSTFTAATVAARDRAVAEGIVINGLPILTSDPELDVYYRDTVIGGVGAFVLPAADYDAFATAIVAKLIREITRAPVAAAPQTPEILALKP